MHKAFKKFFGFFTVFAMIAGLVLPTTLKTVAANEVMLDTKVRLNLQPVKNADGSPNCSGGGAQWDYQVNARRSEVIEFYIHVHNSTSQTSTRTVLRDTLPTGLEYVVGSSRIWSGSTCYAWTEGITGANGVVAQDTQGGGDVYFMFRAKVRDDAAGRLVQNAESWVTIGGQTFYNSNSNAEVTVYGYVAQDPILTLDTKGFNPRLPQGGPQDVIEISAGDQVQFWSYIGNSASDPAAIARNVRIKYTLPSGFTREIVVTGETWADNAARKTDTARSFPTEALKLEYVPGSAKAYNAQSGVFIKSLGDEIVTTGALIGDQEPSWTPAKYVVIEARAVREQVQPGAVKVIKFKDLDGDGIEDSGEPRLAGVLFHLDRNTAGVREAQTDGNGEILWTNVAVGTHEVHEEVPSGFTVTTPNPVNVSVVASQTALVKFGNKPIVIPQQGAVKVIKFKDVDGDGIEDSGEPRLAGVLFHLDRNTANVREATTDANGEILWTNVPAGSHEVHEEVPSGFTVTTPNPVTVSVVSGQTAVVKFGNRPVVVPQQAKVIVIKFKDLDGDGQQDSGELPMFGVRFNLSGTATKSGLTDTNGRLEFADLAAGSYTLTEEVPAGFRATSPNPITFDLAANEARTFFFGNQPVVAPQKAILEVVKFKDLDGDGTRDADEPAIAGVLFTLKLNGTQVKTGTTNEAGLVEWTDLDPGTYTVTELVPSGFTATTPNPQSVTLAANDHKTLFFGNKPVIVPQKAQLKVVKFKDDNGNGVLDAGEGRLSGVTFTANGGMPKVTDANGEATWTDLVLGSYQVAESLPAGYTNTTSLTQTANLTTNGQTVTLFFGNKPVTPPAPPPPSPPKELPTAGSAQVILPSVFGIMGTLYAMVRRQRKYMIDLLRNL